MYFRDLAKYCQNRQNKENKNSKSYLQNSLIPLVTIPYMWRKVPVALVETLPGPLRLELLPPSHPIPTHFC